MSVKLGKWILSVSLILFVLPVFARSYTFRALSVAEGMPDLVVNSIYKDSRGFVWFGTNTTLERFDGVRLKHYFMDGAGGKGRRVYSVTETEEGDIWAGTDLGLFRVERYGKRLVRLASGEITGAVRAFCTVGDSIYIGTMKGLFLYSSGRFSAVRLSDNVFSLFNQVTGIASGEDGRLWVSTMGGLVSVSFSAGKVVTGFFRQEGERAEKAFYNIACVGGRLFLGTMTEGIVEFNPADGTFRPYVNVGCSVISSLSTDGKDMLYVGTDGNGVHFISVSEEKVVRSFRHGGAGGADIRSNSVYSVLVDREGLLWVGFYQMGVDYSLYRSDRFRVYSYGERFTTEEMSVRTFCFHGKQKLVGSRDGFVFVDEESGRFKSFRTPVLRSDIILCSCYSGGQYYIGTYGGGMYVLDPRTLEVRDFNPADAYPFRNGHIFCIRPDADGCLWVGTSDGVYCFRDGKKVKVFTSADSKLPEGNVYEIFFDSSRKGWICAETGMCIWNPSTGGLQTDVFPENFIQKEKVRMVYEISDHQLLFLLEKGSLFVSDLSLKKYGHALDGSLLDGRSLMSVVEDRNRALWISTNNGLFRYTKEGVIVPYGTSDGIPSDVFINCFSLRDENGTLWFGNSRGLVCLPEGNAGSHTVMPYPLAVSGLLVDGVDRTDLLVCDDARYSVSLDAPGQSLTIQFSDPLFLYPGNMAYEYRCGEEGEWIPRFGRPEISFYDFSSGGCVYYIRPIGSSENGVAVDVHFNSSWKMAWVLFAVLGFVVFALFVWFYRKGRSRCTEEEDAEAVFTSEGLVKPAVLEVKTESPEVVLEEEPLPVEVVGMPSRGDLDAKYRTNKLSVEECRRLCRELDAAMHKNRPYTNPNLKIAELASMVGSTSHTLSYLFNQYLDKSYYDYINEFRIEEFKKIVMSEDCSKYTLEALAERCGFSSRASFFRSFKKATGITPNEYIKSIQK